MTLSLIGQGTVHYAIKDTPREVGVWYVLCDIMSEYLRTNKLFGTSEKTTATIRSIMYCTVVYV